MSRLALTALVLAVAALTRSPEVVAWVLVGVGAVWLASYYLAPRYRACCEQIDTMLAESLSDTEDPTALARAVGYHFLPLLTEERVREESAPLVVDAEWRPMNGDAS